jgi:hypothetical protein
LPSNTGAVGIVAAVAAGASTSAGTQARLARRRRVTVDRG